MKQPQNSTNTRKPYVGVFDERSDAELAAQDLRTKGFKDDQIGYAWRDEAGKTHTEGNKSGQMAASGAGTGAVAGGISGALVGLGLPEDEAKYYDQQVRDGRTLMTVRADDRYSDASDIVRRRKGFDFETRNERPLRTTETETEAQVKR